MGWDGDFTIQNIYKGLSFNWLTHSNLVHLMICYLAAQKD